MTAIRMWLAHTLEWTLVGIGIGCLGTYGFEMVEAKRFQFGLTAAFARAAGERNASSVRSGALVGMLDVPRLELSTPVVEGDDDGTLERAAGHLPDTPLPWQDGNSAIAAHRDGLFRPLKNVKVGDEIRFRTTEREYRYRVTGTAIVLPNDLTVLKKQPRSTLTLITCYPFRYVGSAPKRFVVHAERVATPKPAN